MNEKRDDSYIPDIMYGINVHLYCNKVLTDKNQSGTYNYTTFIGDVPVKVCLVSDIIEIREANDIENSIYNTLSNKNDLNNRQKGYLKSNFERVIDNRLKTEKNEDTYAQYK